MQKLPQFKFNEINKRLNDNFGNTEGRPNFRLVWADDETEIRRTKFTPEGLEMLFPEDRRMRKYPDIQERYVLEALFADITFEDKEDGKPVEQLRYMAIWNFEIYNSHRQKVGVAPNYGACKFIVTTVLNAREHPGATVKYTEDTSMEEQQRRIKELEEDLFANETDITDALSIRSGVGYGPGSSPNSTPVKGS